MKDLGIGFGDFFRGARLMTRSGRVLNWALIPIILTLFILVGVIIGIQMWAWSALGEWLGTEQSAWAGALRWLIVVVFFIAMILGAYLVFSLIRQLVACPFNDYLSLGSEKALQRLKGIEQGARGSVQGESTGRTLVRAFTDTVRLLFWEYASYLAVLPFLFIPIVGIAPFWIVRGYYAGINAMDIALSCLGYTYAEKKKVFRANRARLLGLGLGMALLDITIVLALFSLPISVVGGTITYLDLDRRGRLLPAPANA